MENFEVTIRRMRQEDVPVFCELANIEGWNTTFQQINVLRELSPHLYLVAEDAGGQLVSFCGASQLGDDEANIDLYLTRAEYRGKGVGSRLFNACLAAIGNRRVSLYTTPGNHPMYAKSGFTTVSFATKTFRGEADVTRINKLVDTRGCQIKIQPLRDAILEEVLSFDNTVCKTPRNQLLTRWFRRPDMKVFVAKDGSAVVGYVCVYPNPSGFKVMPLYATCPDVARLLWKTAVEEAYKQDGGATLQMYVPVDNADAVCLFTETLVGGGTTVDVLKLVNRSSDVHHQLAHVFSMFGFVGASV